jgi:hypothetical protein
MYISKSLFITSDKPIMYNISVKQFVKHLANIVKSTKQNTLAIEYYEYFFFLNNRAFNSLKGSFIKHSNTKSYLSDKIIRDILCKYL